MSIVAIVISILLKKSKVSKCWKFHSHRTRIKRLLRRLKNIGMVSEKNCIETPWVTAPYRGHKIWSGKDVHMIFISVTYIEGRPLFKGKGQVFLVLKPGFNLQSGDTLALKRWPTTKKVDIFKSTLMTMMAAFTNWTISLTSIYCNIFFVLAF